MDDDPGYREKMRNYRKEYHKQKWANDPGYREKMENYWKVNDIKRRCGNCGEIVGVGNKCGSCGECKMCCCCQFSIDKN